MSTCIQPQRETKAEDNNVYITQTKNPLCVFVCIHNINIVYSYMYGDLSV